MWVASSDYHADIRISKDILKQLSEAYRKIRNTARYILGNLYDFDPNKDKVANSDLLPIDKWALIKLDELIKKSCEAYDNFNFHMVYHSVYNFCVVDMSNFYLDILKDRLYVEKADSKSRRAAQTTIYTILDALTKIISPILAYTSDEIWSYMPHDNSDNKECVLFNDMPKLSKIELDKDFEDYWNKIRLIKETVQKALEDARSNKVIGSSLDAKVLLYANDNLFEFVKSIKSELETIFIVSDVEVLKDGNGKIKSEELDNLSVTIEKAQGEKCERCWTYSDTVGKNNEHKTLCARCAQILEGTEIPEK